MKKFTGFLIIFLGLLLVFYYVAGFMVEKTLYQNIDSLPKNPLFTAKLQQYHRGWFSANANLDLAFHIPEYKNKDQNGVETVQPAFDFSLSFPLIIKHGPIMCSSSGIHLGLGYITTKPQSHYHALVNFLNHTLVTYSLPAFSFKGKQNGEEVQFDWSGMQAKAGITSHVDRLYGNFTLYGLAASAPGGTFQLGPVEDSFDLKYNRIGLWLGENHLSMPLLTASEKQKKIFELKDFIFDTGADIADGKINYRYDMSANTIFANDKNYGPSSLKLSIKNLDAQATADIISQLRAKSFDNTIDSSIMMLFLTAEIPKMLSKGTEIELSELAIHFPEGAAVGNFKIVLPQEGILDPSQFIRKAKGTGQFKAPMAIVKSMVAAEIESDLNKQPAQTPPLNIHDEAQQRADLLLQDMADKGFIEIQGTDYIVHFKIENEHVFVNDQKLY